MTVESLPSILRENKVPSDKTLRERSLDLFYPVTKGFPQNIFCGTADRFKFH